MLIVLDFECTVCDKVAEHLVPSDTQEHSCSCGQDAKRIISGTSFKLDGTDPAFPTAFDRWARQHETAGGQDQ